MVGNGNGIVGAVGSEFEAKHLELKAECDSGKAIKQLWHSL